jgi:predicted MPP superfamily phosphohydrolase
MTSSNRPLFSWLHLSDIHFGHGEGQAHAHRTLVLDQLLRDLHQAERCGAPTAPDALFITGDIGFSGDARGRDEYAQAEAWLGQLTKRLGIEPRHVYLVPGNHDVARVFEQKGDAATFQLVQELRAGTRHLDDVLSDSRERALLTARMRPYLEFARKFGPGAGDTHSREDGLFWIGRREAHEGLRIRIAGLNTSLLANDDEDLRRLWLGLQQLEQALTKQQEGELIIVLTHHPLSWLGDGGKVGGWLESRADVLLCGHVHAQEPLLTQRGGGRRFVQVAAGALHEVGDAAEGVGRFAFNFGAVCPGDGSQLQLQVWPFVLTKQLKFMPDPNLLQDPRQFFISYPLEDRLSVSPVSQRREGRGMTRGSGPEALASALAEYKRAQTDAFRIRRLDLRHLAGIAQGPHETEFDLLDVAVAPSLYDRTEEHGERAATLRRKLRAPGCSPAEKQALREELRRLEQGHWDHHGIRDVRSAGPISFAEALRCHKRFAAVGDAGAGKSVLTRLAFLACSNGEAGERARALLGGDDRFNHAAFEVVQGLRELLPVPLTLGELGQAFAKDGAQSLERFIREQLQAAGAGEVLCESLPELLAAGRVFLLCDGLDEVPKEQRQHVVAELTRFAERYPEVRLLVTARPNGYQPRVPGLVYTRLAPLHYRQQRYLVSRLHQLVATYGQEDARSIASARRRTDALLQALATRPEWYELSSNPLLLTLSVLTPTDEDIPRHRVFVFENYVRTIVVEWRSAKRLVPGDPERLLEAWSAVAQELIRRELRHGGEKPDILRMLTRALGKGGGPAPLSAGEALHLAIETGLVREEGGTVAFWHSMFAEFLAARALTGDGTGAAERIAAEPQRSSLVPQLAAAYLDHVCCLSDEVNALAERWLSQDEQLAGRLLRPGLRAVSDCLVDNVRFGDEVVERVWSTWAEVLERTPPSPLWADFGRLCVKAPPQCLPEALVKRFAQVDDRDIEEVRERLARLVVPYAAQVPEALAACERWFKQSSVEMKLYAAFGLASTGVWTEEVMDALGQFGSRTEAIAPEAVGELVRRGGSTVLHRLRELVRTPSPGKEDRSGLKERRVSAACLLAIAGRWDEAVTGVLKETLSGGLTSRDLEVKRVVQRCAAQPAAQAALIDWLGDDSMLGHHTREIVDEVAPLIEGMPEKVLECTANAEDRILQKLEELLVSIGEERRTLTDTLRRWLNDAQETRSMCAARILRQLAPRDEQLHAALRRGMRSSDALSRVQWAFQTLDLDRELTDVAFATLLECARSSDGAVRELLYTGMHRRRLTPELVEGWLACASDRGVSPAARLAAANFLGDRPEARERVGVILRELLTVEDVEVRQGAAFELLQHGDLNEQAAAIAAEAAARAGKSMHRLFPRHARKFAAAVVQAVLRGLSDKAPPGESDETSFVSGWGRALAELVAEEPSCMAFLWNTLEHSGLAGEVAWRALDTLVEKHASVREALRERLQRATSGRRAELLRLIQLGLTHEEMMPLVLQAMRTSDPRHLTQGQLEWFAQTCRRAKVGLEAARMWRLVLYGPDLKWVLQAAAALVVHFPGEAHEWVQPALTRLLASPDPSQRVNAARLALRCGLLEPEALAALHGCLELKGQPYERGSTYQWFWEFSELRRIAKGPEDDEVLDRALLWAKRVDFEAMHALCSYRPLVGMPRLVAWLDDEEDERFSRAVDILATRVEYRDALRATLEQRSRTCPIEQLERLVYLMEENGLDSRELHERVLARCLRDQPTFQKTEMVLLQWLRTSPEVWAVLRRGRHEPAQRAMLEHLFQYGLPASDNAVAVAVGLALTDTHTRPVRVVEGVLQRWVESATEAGSEQEQEASSGPSPDMIRGWIREALLEQPEPTRPEAIFCFDELAVCGELPADRRIQVLRRMLDSDFAAFEREHGRVHVLSFLAEAGLRLLQLGDRDGRILSVLEEAVHTFADANPAHAFVLAHALLMHRQADDALRQSLAHAARDPHLYVKLTDTLDILARAGFSVAERIDLLIERLALGERSDASAIFDALEALGCGPERRETLLRELASKPDADISVYTRRVLATRADTPPPVAARLLLHVIAQRGFDAREAANQWRARFASPSVTQDKEVREWWYLHSPAFLSQRLQAVERLSRVKEPELVDRVLAELAAAPVDEFLAVYRRACRGDPLSDADWSALTRWLAVTPGEAETPLFAKEWLTLNVWRVAEPRRSALVFG